MNIKINIVYNLTIEPPLFQILNLLLESFLKNIRQYMKSGMHIVSNFKINN